jgi:hypothetical protein
MSFAADFGDMLPHTVTISTRASHNNYGEATFSTSGRSYAARVVLAPKFVRGANGEDVQIAGHVWVASTRNITVDDRITIPVTGSSRPPIVAVERYPDEDGTFHHKLTLGYRGGGD